MLRFRQIRQSDADPQKWQNTALAALLGGEQYPAERLAAGSTVIVMYDADVPAGLIAVSAKTVGEKPRCGVVEHVVLLPQYRRHGFGRILMGMAANLIAERQIWFAAGAVPEDETAQKFAAAIGFRAAGQPEGMWVLDLSDVEGLRYG